VAFASGDNDDDDDDDDDGDTTNSISTSIPREFMGLWLPSLMITCLVVLK